MDNLPINIVDIAIIGTVGVSAIVGFSRGLAREVLSIGAWVGALLATLYGFAGARTFARTYVSPDLLADFIAGAAIFVVVLTLLSGLSKMIGRRVRDSFAGPLDRSFGTAFGLARGAFIVSAIYLLIILIKGPDAARPDWATGSRLLPWARISAEALYDVVPFELNDVFKKGQNGEEIIKKIRDRASSVLPSPGSRDEKGYKREERKRMEDLIKKNSE